MNVLIFGSGGRESAFAWSIAQSSLLSNLFIAPGNPGLSALGTCVNLDWRDRDAVVHFCVREDIHIVVVGPEEPLVHGLGDFFAEHPNLQHIHFIGPKAEAAQLEGSKDFAKAFMMRHGIPTAGYRSFSKDELEAAKMYVLSHDGPYVLKADGLAAGKGVVILDDVVEALKELDAMLGAAKFGAASSTVSIHFPGTRNASTVARYEPGAAARKLAASVTVCFLPPGRVTSTGGFIPSGSPLSVNRTSVVCAHASPAASAAIHKTRISLKV